MATINGCQSYSPLTKAINKARITAVIHRYLIQCEREQTIGTAQDRQADQ